MVDHLETSTGLSPTGLTAYDTIVFLLTSGNVLSSKDQRNAIANYIQGGGSFVGVHSAAETMIGWDWFDTLIGGRPAAGRNGSQLTGGTVLVHDRFHPASTVLPERWNVSEHWLAFDLTPGVHTLALLQRSADMPGYNIGAAQFDQPIAWTHRPFGSRSFYTSLGHNPDLWADPLMIKHVVGGIAWAGRAWQKQGGEHPGIPSGHLPVDTRARSLLAKEGRMMADDDGTATNDAAYEKDTLYNFQQGEQPMSIAIAPDGRVFIVVRNGELQIFNPATSTISTAARWNVTNSNEDGLLGLGLDPDFENNGYIYVYWSPVHETSPTQNILSRYKMTGDTVDVSSEKRLLRINTQRLACCHSGGNIKFDSHGNLLLSVGDNTYQTGWAPTDDRPGFYVLDSQKSAANTNDLRGAINRIRPTEDGYEIPPNNLFPGDDLHRPEIYAMGVRNPFRFSIDPHTNNLYWGDVGPDETAPNPARGPLGMDEINQLKFDEPGNYGWPYCIGPNLPYVKFDYSTQQSTGVPFDCENPSNLSPNNNGAKTGLPPSRPAMVYYNYGPSKDWPQFDAADPSKAAGRCIVAPFFYRYDHPFIAPGAPYRLPPYFDNTLFAADWFRDQIRLLKFDENANILSVTPAFTSFTWLSPMDIEVAPDGSLYIVEFGQGFDLKGARLSRLRYMGVASPIHCQVYGTPLAGPRPLEVGFTSWGSSTSDGLDMTFAWDFNSNGTVDTYEPHPHYVYTVAGVHVATLTITTAASTKSCTIPVDVASEGNTAPDVRVVFPPQGGVFTWGDEVDFKVAVFDAEDGSTEDGGISCSTVQVIPGLGHCPSPSSPCHEHNSITYYDCQATFGPLIDEHSWEKFYYLVEGIYPDHGGLNGAPPLTGIGWSQIMPSVWQTEFYDDKSSPYLLERPTADPVGGETEVYNITDGDWLRYDNWNLFNIDSIRIRAYSSQRAYVDVRIGSLKGRRIATVPITPTAPQEFTDFVAPIEDTNQWFLVDMKAAQTVSRVLLDPGRRPFDYCRGYMLYASLDGVTWGNPSLVPLAFSVATYPYATAQTGTANVSASFTGLVDIKLKTPVSARYLKILQTGTSPATWSISELTVFDDKDKALRRDGWAARASNSVYDLPPRSVFDADTRSIWMLGEPQRPGNVSLFFTFRGETKGATDLVVLNYHTFNGGGISTTQHPVGWLPPVTLEF
ncbi:ptotein with Six-bladed beta-propeller domain [Klebsormidium nitens]|uniref:Ptotein with Six-bladed beta-propeller domain n=1 Tax=Klebsormidium nitens TaxID=105231 RepID=A0A1Y1HV00_KLENI|nr:ptotein with Six-bladed beta-propeller domain [Klebsormidium nitens]|eukprot:GAQ79678.1 ptotein with Six-bladed beta-propeller domain [Klebsormidium nitens]